MSITPGDWYVDGFAIESRSDGNIALINLARNSRADARAIAEVPSMINLLRKLEQKALHMHYASEDAGAILKRIEG